MEEIVRLAAEFAATLVEAAAVLVVSFGAAEAFLRLVLLVSRYPVDFAARKAVWRRFGTWLLLGLEFELAADVIGSVVSPTWQDIGELAAIAVIRTFLNYFLERDLEKVGRPEEA